MKLSPRNKGPLMERRSMSRCRISVGACTKASIITQFESWLSSGAVSAHAHEITDADAREVSSSCLRASKRFEKFGYVEGKQLPGKTTYVSFFHFCSDLLFRVLQIPTRSLPM